MPWVTIFSQSITPKRPVGRLQAFCEARAARLTWMLKSCPHRESKKHHRSKGLHPITLPLT